jgi:uncharacterized protein YlxW (UPF0749 family)
MPLLFSLDGGERMRWNRKDGMTWSRKHGVIIMLMVTLGLLLALQIKTTKLGYKYVQLSDLDSIQRTIEKEKAEIARLSALKIQLTEKELQYQAASDPGIPFESVLSAEIDLYKAFSGYMPLTGPGVIILVSDSERDLQIDEDPNNLVVHDYDIRALIDDLRNAGAEAITINNQRILLGKTELYCTGPTILINNQVFAQPYIITAIGNRDRLIEVTEGPSGYASLLRQIGLYVEVNSSISVKIPAYTDYRAPKYLNLLEEMKP